MHLYQGSVKARAEVHVGVRLHAVVGGGDGGEDGGGRVEVVVEDEGGKLGTGVGGALARAAVDVVDVDVLAVL